MKEISIGDIIYMPEPINEIIEVCGFNEMSDDPTKILYWGDKHPEEVDTAKCRSSDAWVIFERGVKLGSVELLKEEDDCGCIGFEHRNECPESHESKGTIPF